jgi:CHAT domain-containing protein
MNLAVINSQVMAMRAFAIMLVCLVPILSSGQSYTKLLNKGIVAFNESKDSLALNYFAKAKEKLTRSNMELTYEFAEVNYSIAHVHIASKRDEVAIHELEESKAILETLSNKGRTELFSDVVQWLEILYSEHRGDNALIALHESAASYYSATDGRQSLYFIRSLRRISNLYDDVGQFANATIFIDSAIHQLEHKTMNSYDSITYAYCLLNKAELAHVQLRMMENEVLLSQSVAVLEYYGLRVLDDLSVSKRAITSDERELFSLFGTASIALSNACKARGLYDCALNCLDNALQAYTFLDNKSAMATCLENMGHIHYDLLDIAKTDSLYNSAYVLLTENGISGLSLASILRSIGNLLRGQAKYEAAEAVYYRALSQLVADPRNRMFFTDIVYDLGKLYYRSKQFEKAVPQFERVYHELTGIYEGTALAALLDLARTQFALDRFVTTDSIVQVHLPRWYQEINKLGGEFSIEEHQLRTMALSDMDFFASLYTRPELKSSYGPEKLYKHLLMSKSLVLHDSKALVHFIHNDESREVKELVSEWKSKRDAISTGADTSRISFDELNSCERRILKIAITRDRSILHAPVSIDEIRANLGQHDAAVEMLRFEYQGKEMFSDSIVYVALIIGPDVEEHIGVVVLPNGRDLERESISYHNRITNKLETSNSYKILVQPILNSLSLSNVKRIYFAPDGVFHRINIQAMFDDRSRRFVGDSYQIHLVVSTRDVVPIMASSAVQNEGIAYLVGNPTYAKSISADNLATSLAVLTPRNVSDLWNSSVVPSLPGTQVEVDKIAVLLKEKMIPTSVLTKDDATEDNVRLIYRPKILHIASHGFFVGDDPNAQIRSFVNEEKIPIKSHALFQSGLLLTSAQEAISGNRQAGRDDGLLTAFELVAMDLTGTDLVVMSACETGLGRLVNGEGVFGLQRAVFMAGANSLLMSLWKVDDNATQLFMRSFYENWLNTGSKRKGLSLAQKAVQKIRPEPYYWAAFILIGAD